MGDMVEFGDLTGEQFADLILEELVIVQHTGIFIEPAIDGISGIVRRCSKNIPIHSGIMIS